MILLRVSSLLFGALALNAEPLNRTMAAVPLRFEPSADATLFLARGNGYAIGLRADGADLRLGPSGAGLRMRFVGGQPNALGLPEQLLESVTNSYLGPDPAHWKVGIPNFGRVRFANVYPGIDVVYYGNERDLEYDFIVKAGADPSQIRIRYAGSDQLRLDPAGDLLVNFAGKELRQRRPVIYQTAPDGSRLELPGNYRIVETGNEVHFDLAAYDKSRTLIIDPTLVYSTFLGGAQADLGYAIAVESQGASYIAGTTAGGFPLLAAAQPVVGGPNDAFVAKFNAAGGLVFSTYLGGTGNDQARGVALDGGGGVYVTGFSNNNAFPRLNASQNTFGGGIDAFVVKLTSSGALVYSTYLGGSGNDFGNAITADSTGSVFVTGYTDGNFPVVAASQATYGGLGDAFVTKLSPTGARVYSTFLGGAGADSGQGIAVDPTGGLYVTGWSQGSFPMLNAHQSTFGGISDAFLVKLNTVGTRLFSTYLGGSENDAANAVAVDTVGSAYITGSTGGAFPVRNAAQASSGGGTDAFAAKFSNTGRLFYSTFLGGSGSDSGLGIAVDSTGAMYLTGQTSGAFPSLDPSQAAFGGGGTDAFVVKLAPNGSRSYSTYLGGSGAETGQAIAVDAGGAAYVTGSTPAGFPTVAASQSTFGGGTGDAFVTKVGASGVNPTARLIGLSPDVVRTGTASFVLSLSGTGMLPTATVFWNGAPLVVSSGTTIGPTIAKVVVPASLATTAGSAAITVTNPGQNSSNALHIAINATATTPTISTATPAYEWNPANGVLTPNRVVFVEGKDIEPGAVVLWNGVVQTTTTDFFSDGSPVLRAEIARSLVDTPGAASVTVRNPGGVASAALNFTVPSKRFLNGITPTVGFAGVGFTLDLSGSGFAVGDTVVLWAPGGILTALPTTLVNGSVLRATVADANLPNAGTYQVWVQYLGAAGAGGTNGRYATEQDPLPVTVPVCTSFSLSRPSAAVEPEVGTGLTVAVIASGGCRWTATSPASWLTITGGASGVGSRTVTFSALANPGTTPRSTTLTIAGINFVVTQGRPLPCSTSALSQANLDFPAAATAAAVGVSTRKACAWTAVSNAPWLTVTGGATGTGRGVVNFAVATNPAATGRTGTITIAGQMFVVRQLGTAEQQRCTVSPGAVDLVGFEGRTQRMRDMTIVCSSLPRAIVVDLELRSNANVTNRLSAGLTDIALTRNGTPVSNGRLAGYNSVRWPGVALAAGTTTFVISGLLVDTSLIDPNGALPAIASLLRVNSVLPLPLENAETTVAGRQRGLLGETLNYSDIDGLAAPTASFSLQFTESIVNFFNGTGGGAANPGSRLRTVLRNVPAGWKVFFPTEPADGSGKWRLMSADATGAGGTQQGGVTMDGFPGNPYKELPVVNGSVVATWEIQNASSTDIDGCEMPIVIQGPGVSAAAVEAMVANSLVDIAPVSPIGIASATAPIPRFRDFTAPEKRVRLRLGSAITSTGAASVASAGGKLSSQSEKALFYVGTPVVFEQSVANESIDQTATNVTIRSNLPTGLLLTSCSVPCTQNGDQVIIPVSALGVGETRTVTVNTTVGPDLAAGGILSNWSTVDSDDPVDDLDASSAATSLVVNPRPPFVTDTPPISGTGANRTFVFRFTSPNGFAQLDVLNILINRALDGANACYIAYSQPGRVLYLVNDAGTASGLTGPLTLGLASGAVSNNQCIINSAGSSAVGSGNTLTLTLSINFKPSFAGNSVIYLAARDLTSGNSGWNTMGFNEVPPAAVTFPNPVGINPSSGSTGSRVLTFTYDDQTNANNLLTVWGLTNTALNADKACYFAYYVPGNLLLLFPDNGDGNAATAMPLSGTGQIQNSYCLIAAGGSSVTKSGGRLVLNLNITYKTSFAGNRAIWLAMQTVAGQVSAWKVAGAWQVPAQ